MSRGGEETRRAAIGGWLSGRGRESDEREKYCRRWRNARDMMPKLFNSNFSQLLSSLSFLYLVLFALFKHFALIQRSKIITSLNDVTKCRNILYKIYEVPTPEALMFDFIQVKISKLTYKRRPLTWTFNLPGPYTVHIYYYFSVIKSIVKRNEIPQK